MAEQPLPDDQITLDFHILQIGKPVVKKVRMLRTVFYDLNTRPKKTWAEFYELIVKENGYLEITDLTNSN